MSNRVPLALKIAAVALAATGLSSCGFDYATDRYYTPSVGTNDRDSTVDVLAAVVVSSAPGSGTFIASLSNNSLDEEISLDEVGTTEAAEGAPVELEPVPVAGGALVNLAEPATDIVLTGDFEAGDFIEVSLGFSNGEQVTLDVPVVENDGYYADLDGPAPAEETTEAEAPETEQ